MFKISVAAIYTSATSRLAFVLNRRSVLKPKRMAVIFPYGVITGIVRATSSGLSYMLIYLRRVAAHEKRSLGSYPYNETIAVFL